MISNILKCLIENVINQYSDSSSYVPAQHVNIYYPSLSARRASSVCLTPHEIWMTTKTTSTNNSSKPTTPKFFLIYCHPRVLVFEINRSPMSRLRPLVDKRSCRLVIPSTSYLSPFWVVIRACIDQGEPMTISGCRLK